MRNVGSSRPLTNRQKSRDTRERIYVDGNTARRLQTQELPQLEEEWQQRKERRERRKKKPQRSPMNMGYLFVMVASMVIVCGILISYINLQADITTRIEHIASLESELNDLKLSNDETYTKIMSQVDLEEIKRIAIQELGMKYAKEGQVVTYTGEGSDYVTQYSEIPK